MAKDKKDTAGQVTIWDERVEDARRYIIGKTCDYRGNTTSRILVRDGKAVKASDVTFTKEEHERLRKCGELLPVVAADLEKMLAEGQPDDVQKSRRDKLWQFAGLMSELAEARSSIAIIDRLRSGKATEERKRKSRERQRKWQDIVDPLAAKAWRNGSDYPVYHPHVIAAVIKSENEIDAAQDTIGRYLSKNETRVKSFG